MKRKRDKATLRRIEHEAEGAASGAIVGSVVGAAAGPAGVAAGAVIGGIAGALAGEALHEEAAERTERTRELDATIGVTEGDLGAPNLRHPPANVGAYSAASSGAGSTGEEEPAEGPFQPPES
jgi:hypothetical protein